MASAAEYDPMREEAETTTVQQVNPIMSGLPQPLLLGSASFTRKQILKEMGINYHPVVRPIDEAAIGNRRTDEPVDLVTKLAQAKMDHLVQQILSGECDDDLPDSSNASNREEWIVLTADQVVVNDGHILEKPSDADEAKRFAARYAETGRVQTVGCCCVAHVPSRTTVRSPFVATVHFDVDMSRRQADQLVDDLIAAGAPVLSCAGGLMVEHPLVQQYITKIDGAEDSVLGLSKETVRRLLQEIKDKLAK
jgi:septum formation protein